MRIMDWSADVCSSDLPVGHGWLKMVREAGWFRKGLCMAAGWERAWRRGVALRAVRRRGGRGELLEGWKRDFNLGVEDRLGCRASPPPNPLPLAGGGRSEEHTSELQSLMRISYAVFCLKKKKQ